MTATEKRYTASSAGKSIQGVLFLTAGFGTRAEPLSIAAPKALLPVRESTLLGLLAGQFKCISPEVMAVNASRCPELLMEELTEYWTGETRMLFEERPLGAPGTLARNRDLIRGTWVVCNTDFLMDVPVKELVDHHFQSRADWTVLTGDFPLEGTYGGLWLNGVERHYLGVSVISGRIAELAFQGQLGQGFFSKLRRSAEQRGITLNEYFSEAEWFDMGETDFYRKHVLSSGSYIHPTAVVDEGAILKGFYSVGPYCIIQEGALIQNSVMLQGSQILQGASAIETVLPRFFHKEP